ncbi:uncharacterized protein EDB91DRAFT_1088514 [Suillus paluster]|uniref:uncharacterized protein n=1 Tax=Suillus paluster TaxID=48578 RepID=UPI001B877FFB|nr:uncharacterized protein EDB91DRAFT_1088514 [Suillus paluster]KAG1721246.1 hypothetical protein EDB91DRAFT_1088514 [Suillus paluster]
MCSYCLQIMPHHQDIISGVSIKFVCISCHVLAQYHGRCPQNPYFGFYCDGKPIFDTFLQIHGALELSHQAQVLAETVLFIHLNLINNNATGGPFKLAHNFLMPYFPNGGIVFLLQGQEEIYIVTQVNTSETKFLDIVLGPFKDLINLAVESYLWLFCCGTIVNNSESFANLKTSVLQHQLYATVAFNAVHFQPSFTTHILLAFIERVIIKRFSISHAFPHAGSLSQFSSHGPMLCFAWGQYLPVQCPKYWTSSFRGIIAIKKYYGCKIDEEESDEEGAAKAREISARPKEASFYKKKLTDWDVAQRLFKQEINEFDKAEQARKGVKDPIKFRTCHAREWFNQMSLTQKKEVDYTQEKWNTEGAPEESQVM